MPLTPLSTANAIKEPQLPFKTKVMSSLPLHVIFAKLLLRYAIQFYIGSLVAYFVFELVQILYRFPCTTREDQLNAVPIEWPGSWSRYFSH